MIKKEIVIFAIFLTLLAGSFSTVAVNLEEKKDISENNAVTTDAIDLEVADLIINSRDTDANVEIKENLLDLTIPDGDTVIPVNFNFNCIIENEKLANTETWVFIIEMRKYPAGAYIINEEIVKDDVIIETYPWQRTISETVEFSRDYEWERWLGTDDIEQRYSLYIRCEYYDDGVEPGEQAPDDHDVENINAVVELINHDPPNAPTIVSSDINQGDKKSVGEYSITVKSIDPNDDDIRYTINWGDGEFSDYPGLNTYTDSGTEATFTHTYGENHEFKDYKIKIYAKDEFSRMSDITSITFTLPKTKIQVNQNFLDMVKSNFPQLVNLIERLNFYF